MFKKPPMRDAKRPIANRIVVFDVDNNREACRLNKLVQQLGGKISETIDSDASPGKYVGLVSDSSMAPLLLSRIKHVTAEEFDTVINDLSSDTATSSTRSSPRVINVYTENMSILRQTIRRSSPLMRVAITQRVRILTVRMFTKRANELAELQKTALEKGNKIGSREKLPDQEVSMVERPFVYMGDLTGVHAPQILTCDPTNIPMHIGADLHLIRNKSVFDEPSHSTQACTFSNARLQPEASRTKSGGPSMKRQNSTSTSLERDLSPLKNKDAHCGVCKMNNLDLNKHINSYGHKSAVKDSGIFSEIDKYMFSKHDLIPSLHRLSPTPFEPLAAPDTHRGAGSSIHQYHVDAHADTGPASSAAVPETDDTVDSMTTAYLNTTEQRAQCNSLVEYNAKLETQQRKQQRQLRRQMMFPKNVEDK